MSQQEKQVENATRREGEQASRTSAGQIKPEAAPEISQEEVEAAVKEADESLIGHDTLEALQAELEQALAKAEENWNLYLSARAEMDNVRKRAERDRANAHKFALEKFVNELLPVKDSLEMGIAAAKESRDVTKVLEGTELTLKMLSAAMEKFGVQELNPVGAKFNPELHEAMAAQPTERADPNTVLQVVQKGYLLNERLIRPAMVIVAKAA